MARDRFIHNPVAPGSVGDIHRLIRAGRATSRSELARATRLAPSTISSRVDTLIRLGLVRESDEIVDPQRGRRPRSLAVEPAGGFVVAATLGATHCLVVLSDLSGTILARREHGPDPATLMSVNGPERFAEDLWAEICELAAERGLDLDRFVGGAIGVPAPVEYPSGRIVTPSFRPDWHGADLPELFSRYTSQPMLVENDANLLALSERDPSQEQSQLLVVKVGTRIGGGILLNGQLHRGTSGAAGELAHNAVTGTSVIPCSCPVPNCLESVASGGALAQLLRNQGVEVEDTRGVLELAAHHQPLAMSAVRAAGSQLGEAVAAVANVLNPRTVVLGGSMSASPELVAAARARIYQNCLPIVAEALEVRTARHPADGETLGAVSLILDEVLAPARINHHARVSSTGGV